MPGVKACSERSGAYVGDAPDGVGGVVGHVDGSVGADCDAGWTSPDGAVGVDKAGHEVLVGSGGCAVGETDAEKLVAAADGSVPGAVGGDEEVSPIVRGELLAGVKGDLEWGEVGLEEGVADDGLRYEPAAPEL